MKDNFRHLIVIQGDENRIQQQLMAICQKIVGDWVIITVHPELANLSFNSLHPKEAKQLLGREFNHAIFDARQMFNLDAFAVLSGTLTAGSILLLLLPHHWYNWLDQDSLRWNDDVKPKTVPHFVSHLIHSISYHHQSYPSHCHLLTDKQLQSPQGLIGIIKANQFKHNVLGEFANNTEQSDILHQLLSNADDIALLTAKRGRGKSALAGMFCHHRRCWVTAPNKNAVTTLLKFAPDETIFFAPDELILHLNYSTDRPDWLVIDEAAMIPLSLLYQLLNQSYRILLTSTIDGYEGTGQGLLLKLFKQISKTKLTHHYRLYNPIRWAHNDPLEIFTDQLIVADQYKASHTVTNDEVMIKPLPQAQLVSSSELLAQYFGLLKSAHYRTTLLDLRRILDANHLHLYVAMLAHNIIGALVVIEEGGLTDVLVEDIIRGFRRPRGNLVAQSLVAHAGERQAAVCKSLRINRIALAENHRQQGIGTQMIKHLIQDPQTNSYDYLSVSFAYASDVANFWLKLGFSIVHIGTHKEASSGSYAVMAMYPITDRAKQLQKRMCQRLARNWYWLKNRINQPIPIMINHAQQLTRDDKLELTLFATTLYAYSASFAVLSRLANQIKSHNNIKIRQSAPILLALYSSAFNEQSVGKQYSISGKRELIKLLRQEVQALLNFQELFND